MGKPVEERESLQLSSFSPSSSVAVDLHTLVVKAHGSELFFKCLRRDSASKHHVLCKKRRYIVTWVFHMFLLQPEHMMYPRCIKI